MSVSGEEIQIHVQLNIRGTNDYQGIHSYLDIDFYQWHSYKFERKIPLSFIHHTLTHLMYICGIKQKKIHFSILH